MLLGTGCFPVLNEHLADVYAFDEAAPRATLIADGLKFNYVGDKRVPFAMESRIRVNAGVHTITVTEVKGFATRWRQIEMKLDAESTYMLSVERDSDDFHVVVEKQGSSEKRIFQ